LGLEEFYTGKAPFGGVKKLGGATRGPKDVSSGPDEAALGPDETALGPDEAA